MLRILVVEDDEKIRDCFAQFFKLKGHHVTEAKHGAQAVSLAGAEAFDLILMDVKMPKLDGLSACTQIRQIAPTTKVVLTTGFRLSEEGEEEDVIRDDSVECLRKPIFLKALQAILDRLTEERPEKPSSSARRPT